MLLLVRCSTLTLMGVEAVVFGVLAWGYCYVVVALWYGVPHGCSLLRGRDPLFGALGPGQSFVCVGCRAIFWEVAILTSVAANSEGDKLHSCSGP